MSDVKHRWPWLLAALVAGTMLALIEYHDQVRWYHAALAACVVAGWPIELRRLRP